MPVLFQFLKTVSVLDRGLICLSVFMVLELRSFMNLLLFFNELCCSDFKNAQGDNLLTSCISELVLETKEVLVDIASGLCVILSVLVTSV